MFESRCHRRISHWWHQEEHAAKFVSVHQKVPREHDKGKLTILQLQGGNAWEVTPFPEGGAVMIVLLNYHATVSCLAGLNPPTRMWTFGGCGTGTVQRHQKFS